jgi:hypothetical protein
MAQARTLGVVSGSQAIFYFCFEVRSLCYLVRLLTIISLTFFFLINARVEVEEVGNKMGTSA